MSLKIEGLSKSFGEKKLFSDFSYSFSDTGVYVIKGESGAGKTTLLRMIAPLPGRKLSALFFPIRRFAMRLWWQVRMPALPISVSAIRRWVRCL